MRVAESDKLEDAKQFESIVAGVHDNPFSVLGVHRVRGQRIVRTFQPQARAVSLVNGIGDEFGVMRRVHDQGIFVAAMPPNIRHYLLRIETHDGRTFDAEDIYRFPSALGELDLYLMGEGSHRQIYNALGAHEMTMLGVRGTRFAVWAPNAGRVGVVGDFNEWDGRRAVMRLHPDNGVWEIFIPGIAAGAKYKYELLDRQDHRLPLKNDPYGHYFEPPPGNASTVYTSHYRWRDEQWMQRKSANPELNRPMSIYEVHLGSWRRNLDDGGRSLSYQELAHELVEYVADMGFTHVEFLPVNEHPFEGSWGYQPVGIYAPTQRFGEPDDFRYLVDCFHNKGIAVIVDWVPAHFPRDEHGLARFDGSALYEHEDPRKGEHADWGTLIFNYGRREVMNYLIGSALYWINELHVDALRVDAVASMLYLDYSREDGEWVANEFGGNENLEAVQFLRQMNEAIHAAGGTTHAEESTAWAGVSHPTYSGGLGFTFKWNMGWMHDSLAYIAEQPVHRKWHHDKMTFSLVYAFNENFVLPLSHDEVVHGKRSILGRMPGDEWQRFANLRAYYGFMYAHPGKKLLFMGAEIGQTTEWNHGSSLDWHLLDYQVHSGVQTLIRKLNRIYSATPALYQIDFEPEGFEWIRVDDRENSVYAWIRRDGDGGFVLCLCNFTPETRQDFRIGVPEPGIYREIINTDEKQFGGSGQCNMPDLTSIAEPADGCEHSLNVTLPPLATIYLQPGRDQ